MDHKRPSCRIQSECCVSGAVTCRRCRQSRVDGADTAEVLPLDVEGWDAETASCQLKFDLGGANFCWIRGEQEVRRIAASQGQPPICRRGSTKAHSSRDNRIASDVFFATVTPRLRYHRDPLHRT